MPKRTPQQIAAAWKKNLGSATESIKQGVQAVQESPMEKAAAAQDLMRSQIIESIDSGRWAANTRAVPLTSWKSAMLGKGLQNLQSGLADGETKTAAYQTMAAPIFDQAHQAAAAILKDGTENTALAKVAASMRLMKTLKGRMKNR